MKAGHEIVSLDPETSGTIFRHPAQQAHFRLIAALIQRLRACQQPLDFYDFQKHLFQSIYKVEERRSQCRQTIRRLESGKGAPVEMRPPDLTIGSTPLADWQFEALVYERLARQLRVVGDGLAWRCFGYDRGVILTLSRNASPGMMYGKEGLPYELGRIEDVWRERGNFALHHDLTNCLRIGDLTEFTADNGGLFHEVKRTRRSKKSRSEKEQIKRIELAVGAIMNDGPLPGDRTGARLVRLAEPYAANLRELHELIQLAKRHGCRGMKLPGGRALVATSLFTMVNRWGGSYEDGVRQLNSVRQRAIKRAGIDNAMHHLKGVSGDTAARSEIQVPWSIYPFSPEDCAALICDLIVFETIISVDALVASLDAVGVRSEILLPAVRGSIVGGKGVQDVLRLHWGNRAMVVHAPGLGPLLFELIKPDTWASGMLEAISALDAPTEPALVFSGEELCWYHD